MKQVYFLILTNNCKTDLTLGGNSQHQCVLFLHLPVIFPLFAHCLHSELGQRKENRVKSIFPALTLNAKGVTLSHIMEKLFF